MKRPSAPMMLLDAVTTFGVAVLAFSLPAYLIVKVLDKTTRRNDGGQSL
jgi:hypothetical protein